MAFNNKNLLRRIGLGAAGLTAAITFGCGGNGSSSNDKPTTPPVQEVVLSADEVLSIANSSAMLNNCVPGGQVTFADGQSLGLTGVCENGDFDVGVAYNVDETSIVSPSSVDSQTPFEQRISGFNKSPVGGINFVLSVPQGTQAAVEQRINSLEGEEFNYSLSERKDFGNYQNELDRDINGNVEFMPTPNEFPTASIFDDSGNLEKELQLSQNADGTFSFPDSVLSGLGIGEKRVVLSVGGADYENAASFQVIAYDNTAPVVEGVAIEGEDAFATFNGSLRDVNGVITLSYGNISDAEDSAKGIETDVFGVVKVDGQAGYTKVPLDESGNLKIDLSNYSGNDIEAGFGATDSNGATSYGTLEKKIAKNSAPNYVGSMEGKTVDIPFEGSYAVDKDFEDPESDSYSSEFSDSGSDYVVEQPDGSFAFEGTMPGSYEVEAAAVDEYGAVGASPLMKFNVADPLNCLGPDGSTILHDASKTYFNSSSVSYGSSCESQSRTCYNGELDGSYQYSTCNVDSDSGDGGDFS